MSTQTTPIPSHPEPINTDTTPPKQLDNVYGTIYNRDVIRTLWEMIRPYFWQISFAMFLNLLTAVTLVAGPYFVKMALDDGITAANPQRLLQSVIYYVLVSFVQWASIYFRFSLMSRVGQSIIYDFRKRLFAHLQVSLLEFFQPFQCGARNYPGDQ